jgi:hypothetical protein
MCSLDAMDRPDPRAACLLCEAVRFWRCCVPAAVAVLMPELGTLALLGGICDACHRDHWTDEAALYDAARQALSKRFALPLRRLPPHQWVGVIGHA